MTIAHENPLLANSLWNATSENTCGAPELTQEVEADVCIIGGGIAGLSTALHSAEAGLSVVVVEAQTPGWGGSGRNGGQVLPGLKEPPREVEGHFGEMGKRMTRVSGAAPDLVFELIEKHGIKCGAVRKGWIHAASASGVNGARDRAQQWRDRGADVRDLDERQTREMLGGGDYSGALWDMRGGGVHPLDYSIGLAQAAMAAGVRIFGHSPVERLAHDDGWKVTTAQGSVTAKSVAICTNAYSGPLHDTVRKNIVPVCTIQVATDPLPDTVLPSILPCGQVVSDTLQRLLYFRQDAHGRFLIGGAGAYSDAGLKKTYAELKANVSRMFPQLNGLEWRFSWGGDCAVTVDHLPHLAELAPGLHTVNGFNGRGVAFATMMGKILSQRLAGAAAEDLDFPTLPLRTIPLHRFHRYGVDAALLLAKITDSLRGR